MKYLSVCSGVEAASQAWQPLGWEAVAFSEIEPFPCAVLASRFPNVPNLGDMSKIHYDRERKELTNGTTRLLCPTGIDLIVGGTPCQSFSVAGKRAGLEGASGLAYHYARLIGEIRPRWFVWENVPGALSSVTYGDQRDFNFLLQQFSVGGNADLGCRWDLCWRVLDTQYVRVERYPRAIPQRRRRVFVVGHLAADCGCGCEVLLEPEGVRGDPAPSRVKGQGSAGDFAAGVGGADGEKRSVGFDPAPREVLKRQFEELETTIQNGTCPGHHNAVAISFKGGQSAVDGFNATVMGGATQTLTGARVDSMNNPLVSYHYAVRRITPIEGERLQGFADNWTRPCFTPDQITDALVDQFRGIHQNWSAINGKPDAKPQSREWVRNWLAKISSHECPDGPRYKAIGNSMSVNVMSWIGQRIQQADNAERSAK